MAHTFIFVRFFQGIINLNGSTPGRIQSGSVKLQVILGYIFSCSTISQNNQFKIKLMYNINDIYTYNDIDYQQTCG